MDGHPFDLSIALDGGNGLVGSFSRFIVGLGIGVDLGDFPFGRSTLSLLRSDRLKALSLSICLTILSVGSGINDTLLLSRSTLLRGRSDRVSCFSVGVDLEIGTSSNFLSGRALLGWLSGVIVGRSGSTALLGCLRSSLGVVPVGGLVCLGLSAKEPCESKMEMEKTIMKGLSK